MSDFNCEKQAVCGKARLAAATICAECKEPYAAMREHELTEEELDKIEEAKDKADSRWVSALKPFKITVDSPESLAASVQMLIEEAVGKERERIKAAVNNLEFHYNVSTALEKAKGFSLAIAAVNEVIDGQSLKE